MGTGQRRQKRRYLAACIAFLLAALYLLPEIPAGAADRLKLSDSSLSLIVGNNYQLEITEGYDPGKEEDYDNWWDWLWRETPYYESSNVRVVQVDQNGMLHAVGVGSATITVNYDNMSATCKVKVKANSCKISAEELTLYEGQSATVSLSYSKQKAVSYDVRLYEVDTWERYGDYWGYDSMVVDEGKGKFTIHGDITGDYYVELIMNAANGKSYSAFCLLHVEKTGLENSNVAVAVGKTQTLSLRNAENITYESTDKSIVTVSSKGKIKGISEGQASIKVVYTIPTGEERLTYCQVYVTNPVYVPVQKALIMGNSYSPELEGISYYSTVKISSSDESVIYVYDGRDYAYASGVGTATVTVTADGIEFKQEIRVINPQLSANYAMLVKGKTKTLKVTGAEKDSTVTYASSDTSVAKVSKKGKITAVGAGSATVSAQVDGATLYCSVIVAPSSTNGVKAVQEGEKVLGALYDQDKRMQKGYYDCSSFVWRSYNEAGVKLGDFSYAPTAAELAKKLESQGKAIAYEYLPASELKPGDLIFYAGGPNGRYKNINHVAMYYGTEWYKDPWTGEAYAGGMIIHASGTVHIRDYGGYITGAIVMIARPYGK